MDERSAAFFALGAAKRQRRPVALVCTSGTAGANFYPAVIEAYESAIPLILFTADRPPEMRDCASGQTIDQHRLYGHFVKQYSELAVPSADATLLAYLRQTIASAWRRAISPLPGPIHFNCPFRDPLPPIEDLTVREQMRSLSTTLNPATFFSAIAPPPPTTEQTLPPLNLWQQCSRGLIIAGPTEPNDPKAYAQSVAQLSQALGWPVLAEGLSPLRNYQSLSPTLVSTYDLILRNQTRAESLVPETILQLGALPISKVLRQWLQKTDAQRWLIGSQRNLDPLHGPTQFLSTTVETLAKQAKEINKEQDNCLSYRQQWMEYEQAGRAQIDSTLSQEDTLVESKVAWLLSQRLPPETPLFIANSMPVRDVEYVWTLSDRYIRPYFSRGANGIDGTLSTAMGLAHNNKPTVLLTGDLALLHDTNGFLNRSYFSGHLTIVMINNNGGGIFEMLPVSQFEPEFQTYFVTPQSVNFESLCATYGIDYQKIETINALRPCIEQLPTDGIRLLELICDRKQSVQQRKNLLAKGEREWPI